MTDVFFRGSRMFERCGVFFSEFLRVNFSREIILDRGCLRGVGIFIFYFLRSWMFERCAVFYFENFSCNFYVRILT